MGEKTAAAAAAASAAAAAAAAAATSHIPRRFLRPTRKSNFSRELRLVAALYKSLSL